MSASLGLMALLLAAAGAPAGTPPAPVAPTRDVGFDQRLGEQVPFDLAFLDESGKSVTLGDCCRQRPTILVLTCYRCASLCTLVHNALIQALHEMPVTVGRDANVVLVSFDPRETADLAAAKKKVYLAHYGRRDAAGGWHCLTGRPEAIAALTGAVGFRCRYDPVQQEFIHPAGLLILTPDGRISRALFGILYPAAVLQTSLTEAAAGKIGPRTAEPPRFCFHFDPGEGRHTATILTLARVLGGLSFLAVAGLVWFLVRRTGAGREDCRPPLGVETFGSPPAEPVLAAEQGETP